MPRGGRRVPEKSKDFKGAMKRLFSELKIFRILISVALILACFSSILSIVAPNKLSDLADEIAKGLVIRSDNLQNLSIKISENIQKSELVTNYLASTSKDDATPMYYSSDNSINLGYIIDSISKMPEEMQKGILPDIVIDGVKINYVDQIEFMKVFSSLNGNTDVNSLYRNVEKLPDSVKSVIKPVMNIDVIKDISIFLVSLYLISALFSFAQSLMMTTVSNNFARDLRNRITKKINLLPLSYFDKHQTGNTLSIITNDIDTIAQSMNQSLATLVSSVTLFVGSIIMMFYTNYILALTAIVSSLLGFVFMGSILGKSQKYFIQRQVELGKLNSVIEETYSGLLVVKAYNAKEECDEKFDKCNKSVYEANRKSQFLSGLMMPMMHFVGNLGYVAVCIVGAILTQKEIITFGVIIAFITYVRLFNNPLSQIAQAFTSLQSTAAASERVFEFIDEKELSDESNIKLLSDRSSIKGNIEFKNVKFGYNEDRVIIEDFTAKVKDGQKIAIVGPTGAGKTTMVNLLMKFYDINSGDIIIDNKSIHDIKREDIHSLFTMVLQDTWLFNDTLRANIKYNREDISDDEIWKVCDKVGLTHFIKTLPNGLDTNMSENDSVSAGQKQLITIARGMLEDAPFLILDEATSNVDTRTEELVQKAMDKLMEGRTSFIIAHRLSTIKNADLILVMKDGNIIETGNHDELLKQNGFYSKLYNSQFEL